MRWLEREIGRVLRSVAVEVAEGKATKVQIGIADIEKIAGDRCASRTRSRCAPSVPGVATGLAWTPVGGDILFIEATRSPGGGRLILTGQLGEVMRESAAGGATAWSKNKAAALEHRPGLRREDATSTCTCRPAPRPRTGRARAWPCSRR